MLNKQNGNMYSWVSHTWNPIRGKCPHDCLYCYMKKYPQPGLHLDEKCLKDYLGEGNIIFVGSSTDMWAVECPDGWIDPVLEICRSFRQNTYLFQSKNPARFIEWAREFPAHIILGTTIETNRDTGISKAPDASARADAMAEIIGVRKMISIEPVMDFDLQEMIDYIGQVQPEFVSIGADSKNCNLPEPSGQKVKELISEAKKLTKVKTKANLKRLLY